MELWIRSQDKRHLIKANYVSIMENNIINVASSGWDYNVAKYKTKERALEVLDEIQQALLLNDKYDYTQPPTVSNMTYNLIFEMPKE